MSVKIKVTFDSQGDEPFGSLSENTATDVLNELKRWLAEFGFTNIAEGSGDGLEHGGKRWWVASYERTIE